MNKSLLNLDEETRIVLGIVNSSPNVLEEKEEVPFSVLGIDLSGSDTAPPPILSTDVTEDQASQLLEPYTPPEQVGGYFPQSSQTDPYVSALFPGATDEDMAEYVDRLGVEAPFEIP